MRSWICQLRGFGMRFLRWWAGELTAAAEAVLAWIAPRRFKMLAVFVDRAEISAAYAPTKSDGQPLVVTARHGANAPLPAQPPSSWQSIVTRRPRTRLVLGMSAAYRHTFYLPLAALSQVASAAALQYPRLLPVSPDQLLLDYRRVQDHSAEAIVEFTLAALKRKDTELLVESLENWGLKVRDIQIGDGLVTTAPFHFAVPGRRARVRLLMPRLRPIDRWLLRSATALGVICLSLALTQQLRAERAVILAEAAAR